MPTILLADDDEKVRAALRRLLTRAGYQIIEASDGRECLELLRTRAVELLILDIFMPEVDGMQVIAGVRRDFPGLPILAISGGGTVERDETLDVARRFGATRTLAKPLQHQGFLSAVRELLGER